MFFSVFIVVSRELIKMEGEGVSHAFFARDVEIKLHHQS
jgi:hypothetical protein